MLVVFDLVKLKYVKSTRAQRVSSKHNIYWKNTSTHKVVIVFTGDAKVKGVVQFIQDRIWGWCIDGDEINLALLMIGFKDHLYETNLDSLRMGRYL